MTTSNPYLNTEDYIRGEYGGELPTIRTILNRHGVDNDALVLDIVGYYTGCLRADGTPRVSRRLND